jgi:tetratricopeptide (TPR) repeat protein
MEHQRPHVLSMVIGPIAVLCAALLFWTAFPAVAGSDTAHGPSTASIATTQAPILGDMMLAANAAGTPFARARALQAVASLAETKGAFAEALRNLEAARLLCTGHADAIASLRVDSGRLLLKLGDLEGAQSILGLAADAMQNSRDTRAYRFPSELNKPMSDVWTLLGGVAKAGGKYPDARQYYEAAIQNADTIEHARLEAAMCDVLQLQRHLGAARKRCETALRLQPVGDPDRPMTQRVLGLIYYFAGDPRRARGVHLSAQAGLEALRRWGDADWLREYVLDDEVAILADSNATADEYTPLAAEMQKLIEKLLGAREPIWWRVSDAQLRLADMYRKQQRFALAEEAVSAALDAFQRRPAGYDKVPDYATIFELAGVLAREQGKTGRAVEEFSEALRILEGCTDAKNMDVRYLRDEIKELEELSTKSGVSEALTPIEE